MKILSKTIFGSYLYGTSVPGSDIDHRSVYLPEIRDCALLRVRDSWEDRSEGDRAFFSLQKLLMMAVDGQSVAIELLSAPNSISSPIWDRLQANRKMFYSKSMNSFLDFAKSMAGKYSVRIDRLNETSALLEVLRGANEYDRLGEIWEQLPETVNLMKGTNERQSGDDKRAYRICGRELQTTVRVGHAIDVTQRIFDSYGERVRLVSEGRIEWKSMMHAFRVALQCQEIAETGDLVFPLKDAAWLKSLRLGALDFKREKLDERLDLLINDVQAKLDSSSLPDKVDRAFADQVILEAYDL